MRTALGLGLAVLIICLQIYNCKVVGSEEKTYTIKDLKFENGEISGWNEDEDGFTSFNASNMQKEVNGEAVKYTDKGMIEGIEQKMVKEGNNYEYQGWICDFGTSEAAMEMYESLLLQFQGSKETAGSFPETEAFLETDPSYGCDGYANFSKYVLWISLDEYGTNKSQAKQDVISFMENIKKKINDMN